MRSFWFIFLVSVVLWALGVFLIVASCVLIKFLAAFLAG